MRRCPWLSAAANSNLLWNTDPSNGLKQLLRLFFSPLVPQFIVDIFCIIYLSCFGFTQQRKIKWAKICPQKWELQERKCFILGFFFLSVCLILLCKHIWAKQYPPQAENAISSFGIYSLVQWSFGPYTKKAMYFLAASCQPLDSFCSRAVSSWLQTLPSCFLHFFIYEPMMSTWAAAQTARRLLQSGWIDVGSHSHLAKQTETSR